MHMDHIRFLLQGQYNNTLTVNEKEELFALIEGGRYTESIQTLLEELQTQQQPEDISINVEALYKRIVDHLPE